MTEQVQPGISAVSRTGEAVAMTDQAVEVGLGKTEADPNPLGEPEIDVEAQVEFYNEGVLRKPGERFKLPRTMAMNASQFVKAVSPAGVLVPLNVVPAQELGRVNVAGMARHERLAAYRGELLKLDERRDSLVKMIEHEERTDVNAPQPVSPSPAFTPGTSGAPGTTSVPARPGEPTTGSSGTPTPPSGAPARPV